MSQKVQVDLLLSDFYQCTACVYMAESVSALPPEIQELIHVDAWDMRTLEGVQRFKELHGKSLPSLALDGEVIYHALIPEQEELIQEIKSRHTAKQKGQPVG